MKKRLLSMLLALCMALALLSACAEKQEPAEPPEAPPSQEQDTPQEEPDTPPQEQDGAETPTYDGIPRVSEDAAPLKLYDDPFVYGEYWEVRNHQPYIIGESLYSPDALYTYSYDSNVIFEGSEELAEQLLEEGKNPGLGVRGLHAQGITGEGVNVAIIDQKLLLDHPEYADCIAEYYDSGCGEDIYGSMHGPGVLSILAGKTLGVAPGAKVYFAAKPNNGDAAYYADCLYWIIEQNEALPEGEKIRVVSVSSAPDTKNSFTNGDQWVEAVAAAEAAGILVIDCRSWAETGFVLRSYCKSPSDDPAQYRPGTPRSGVPCDEDTIYAPSCFRTTALEYYEGEYLYTHWGEGGLSWAVPYVAGVLALGWQVNPELDAQTMKNLLLESAWVYGQGFHMIDPPAFIEMVRATVN